MNDPSVDNFLRLIDLALKADLEQLVKERRNELEKYRLEHPK